AGTIQYQRQIQWAAWHGGEALAGPRFHQQKGDLLLAGDGQRLACQLRCDGDEGQRHQATTCATRTLTLSSPPFAFAISTSCSASACGSPKTEPASSRSISGSRTISHRPSEHSTKLSPTRKRCGKRSTCTSLSSPRLR